MKNEFIVILILFASVFSLPAQMVSENAIGLRLGDSDGFGAEISYQRALNDLGRIEVDLGWRSSNDYDGFKFTGLYQWVWLLDGNFNWFTGVGGGLASYNFKNDLIKDETFVFIAGDVGIEYNFDIPLVLSLDIRPEFGFGNINDDLNFDIGLGIRYQF